MKKLFKWMVVLALVSSILAISAVGVSYLVFAPDLPEVESLREVQMQVPLRVFSEDGKLLGIFGEKRRIPDSTTRASAAPSGRWRLPVSAPSAAARSRSSWRETST